MGGERGVPEVGGLVDGEPFEVWLRVEVLKIEGSALHGLPVVGGVVDEGQASTSQPTLLSHRMHS